MKVIQKLLLPNYPDIKTTKTYNENGSLINHLLCHFENKILQLMINHIQQKNINKDLQ